MKEQLRYTIIVSLVILGILFQPFGVAANRNPVRSKRTSSHHARQTITNLNANLSDTFLPIIRSAPSAPAIQIIQPFANTSISGSLFFAVQPTNSQPISSVTFRANGATIGIDSSAADGWRVFLDASSLQEGSSQLTATATGPGGTVSESVTVNVIPNPPAEGTIDTTGGVLASEIGSVITFPPDAVSDGSFVSVTEKSQEQVTAETGIDWESIGVTFLGAQDIQTDVEINRPLGVSSAGFGNRVQPGQAIVNYRIIPDVDGDGIDEIVVVNTASVVSNNDVISDPVPQIDLEEFAFRTPYQGERQLVRGEIAASPGTFVEFEVNGFNPYSLNGNVAVFKSLVDGSELGFAGQVKLDLNDPTKQIFRTAIPYFPAGAATLTFKNESTGATTEEINLTIASPSELSKPASEIFDEYFMQFATILDDISTQIDQDTELTELLGEYTFYLDESILELTTARTSMQEVFSLLNEEPAPEVEILLDDAAKMIENSKVLGNLLELKSFSLPNADPKCAPSPLDREGLAQDYAGFMPFGTLIFGGEANPLEASQAVAAAGGRSAVASAIGGANTGLAAASIQSRLFNNIADNLEYARNLSQGKCDDVPPPSPSPNPSGTGSSGGMTGMGAAPPPGGNGWGNSGGGGGGLRALQPAKQEAGRYIIKMFTDNAQLPFTGLTDAGGYFFIPFIPDGEPFSAIAIDTVTGDTRAFEGIGPPTGESVFIFFDFFNDNNEPSISWDGGGDGTSWSDPLNWDSDRLPNASDRVLIDMPNDIVVTYTSGDTSIISLQSEEAFSITGGSLTVQASSTVNNTFSMAERTSLTASGNGASFTATSASNIDGASLSALNGGTISFPQLSDYNGHSRSSHSDWLADGEGSSLNFPNMATLTGNTFVNASIFIEALDGGSIDLSSVANIDGGHVVMTADGTNSEINLSSLTSFVRTGRGTSALEPINGGSILTDNLTSLEFVNLVLDETGTMTTSQITTFVGGEATVSGFAPDFSGMTMIDAAGFIARNGATISLPQITDYNGYTGSIRTFWTAEGQNSAINFPNITTLTGNTFVNVSMFIEALDGGTIDLSGVANIDGGNVVVKADGANSEVNLSNLASFIRTVRGTSALEPSNGGSILVENLTNLEFVNLVLDETGTMTTSQITTFVGGEATVSGFAPDFSGMTMIDAAGFIAQNGATISLPQITDYNGNTGSTHTTWQANGASSSIDFSGITTLTGNTFTNAELRIEALNGGNINLSAVADIDGGHTQFLASGPDSEINLSTLASFTDTGRGDSTITARSNGNILLNVGTTTVNEVAVAVENGGTLSAGTLVLNPNSTLVGDSILNANVVNSGTVHPGASPGLMTINGSYTQNSDGTLEAEIGGLAVGTDFDQLAVSGAATLAGTLNISLVNNYVPELGASFSIITADSLAGTFATINGTSIGNGNRFQATYGVTSVLLEVLPE